MNLEIVFLLTILALGALLLGLYRTVIVLTLISIILLIFIP